MNELHLFAGAGGGILAGQLRGNRCVCAVEIDPYAQAVLVARQNDGILRPFPIWDDVRTFDGRPWRGIADVVAGGFPCNDVSAAGTGAGLDGEHSSLWTEMARIIREAQPRQVEVENDPMLTSRGLGRILGDLAAMGFDAQWGVLSAADAGAPHLRERIWILANARSRRRDRAEGGQVEQQRRAEAIRPGEARADADGERHGLQEREVRARWNGSLDFRRWPPEPGLGRVADGVAHRVDRVRALGMGQVPRVAVAAFTLLDH
ncbi:DNA cytosine methyltransferase [Caballeronia sp. ATUFL_M2_KS44]|uniref:DNA cytosine methyltransferase n=1 Tax=Caballeronia sp. ATUFL_M2_KS44 TaxID=2921767 RepID=UPI0032EDB9F9